MNAITIGDGLVAQLSGLREKIALCDDRGTVLGYFTPIAVLEAELVERLKAHVDPEELGRRKRAGHGKGHALDDVLAHLKSLERPT